LKVRIFNLMFVSAALFAFCAEASADDKKDIEALYAKLGKHIKANDPDAITSLETPDFKAKGRDGKMQDGKQLAAQMKQESAGNKMKKFDIKVTKMTIRGKAASVDTSFDAVSEMVDAAGAMGPKGKKHKMAMTGTVHNELAKTKDGWKFKSMEEKGGTMKMDGKPFDPSKMGGAPPKK
jgi:ketosteroid isomerase-like protein